MIQEVSDEKVKVGKGRGKNKVSTFLPASGDTNRIATLLHETIQKVPSQEKAEQILQQTNIMQKEGIGQIQLEEGILLHNRHGKLNQLKRRHNDAGGTMGKCPQS
jgi:hypothetical protein